MIVGFANPLAPLLPGRRVVLASCAAEPAALAPAAESPPPVHVDTSSSPTLHVSAALSRWSCGRALRSGWRLSRTTLSAPLAPPTPSLSVTLEDGLPMAGEEEEDGDVCLAERFAATGKTIYIVSKGERILFILN
jgi:[pyruvate, phosphate dikinase]-phosphate phosphotransferase / [pyruvate, phosphate dikinase] kinase